MRQRFIAAILVALGAWWAGTSRPAAAQDLAIGLGRAVTSIDPHFHNTGPNNSVAAHIYDRLIHHDARQRPVPGLAVSWSALDELTWEFRLRPGVRFHDGSAFGADDVVATFARAPNVPNSPSSFALYTRAIAAVEKVDDLTVRLRTREPHPLLPNDVSAINIVARGAARATTAEFDSGAAAIGTGPYRVAAWRKDEQLVLERNAQWWGGATPWARVAQRIIVNDAARVAALLAGDVQAIEVVPTADVRKLEGDPRVALAREVSNRLLFLNLDQARDVTPFVADRDGRPLARNPFKDVRVRRAISKAINRAAIADRLQEGLAIPAGGVIPDGFYGSDPTLAPEPFDLDGARRLLAEAGHPDGFSLTLHGPNDRYPNDEKVTPGIAQMLARLGLATKVELLPWSVYAARASRQEFSATFFGWGAATGEASSPLRSLMATVDAARGLGASNRGRYSNPAFDAALTAALRTIDDGRRELLLREATRIGIADVGIVPLYYQVNVWALRRGLDYEGRADDQTHAWLIRPQR
ncbi:MAG: ABC transporter substrate-binding protein [Alphaproteobacteria bacterium]|nr:ABC transporter substrate-binding protein [Alphaproteobacteria bacterium]